MRFSAPMSSELRLLVHLPDVNRSAYTHLLADPIPEWLGKSYVFSEPLDIEGLFGVSYPNKNVSYKLPHLQDDLPYVHTLGQADGDRYGTLLNGVSQFLHVFGDGKMPNPRMDGQHDVFHTAWRGECTPIGEHLYAPDGKMTLNSVLGWLPTIELTRLNFPNSQFGRSVTSSSNDVSLLSVTRNVQQSLGFFHAYDMCREIKSWSSPNVWKTMYFNLNDGHNHFYRFTTAMIRDFEFSLNAGSLDVSYHLQIDDGPTPPNGSTSSVWHWLYLIQLHYSWTHQLSSRRIQLQPSTNYPLASTSTATVAYKMTTVERSGSNCAICPNGFFVGNTVSYAASYTGSYANGYYWIASDFVKDTDRSVPSVLLKVAAQSPRDSFTAQVKGSLPDIRAAASVTTSTAVASSLDELSRDIIQTLVKLNQIAELLPDFRRGYDLLRDMRHLNVATIRDVVKYLSGEYLRNKFSQNPDYRLLTETLPEFPEHFRRLDQLSRSEIVGYGHLDYSFPKGTFGRDSSQLVARTKVVCGPLPSGIVRDLLGLQSVGLIPDAGVLWDLIPYSFAINWISGIADRIAAIENLMALALLDLRSLTHSYLITSPLSEDDLYKCGLQDVGVDASVLRVYIREISAYIPTPVTRKFDFLLPTVIPNWLLPAALLLQHV